LLLAGQGEIIAAPNVACNIVGDFSPEGQARNAYNCSVAQAPNVQAIPDPLGALTAPPIPMVGATYVYPTPPVRVTPATTAVPPAGCPGSATPATHAAPATCQFPASHAGTTWRLYPGYYPGGINLEGGTFYLEPGIYWIGGGGFRLGGGTVSVITTTAGGTTTGTGAGILIYNSSNPARPAGEVVLQGGGANSVLWPLDQGTPWDSIAIFHDRTLRSPSPAVRIVGAASSLEVRGIVYVPNGTAGQPSVLIEGNGGNVTTDQVIAYRFRMSGNFGTLNVAYDGRFLPSLSIAGLIE